MTSNIDDCQVRALTSAIISISANAFQIANNVSAISVGLLLLRQVCIFFPHAVKQAL